MMNVSFFRDCFAGLYGLERRRITMPPVVSLRMNRGERPGPMPGEAMARIGNELAKYLSKLQQYPSYQEFYTKLAAHIGFPSDMIVLGAGIEEFIKTLTMLCCDPGQKMAVLWPSCAMYDIYASAFDVDLIRIKPVPGVAFPMSDFIGAIPSDTRLVFVPNPSQPVELHYGPDELRALAEYCADIGAILAIDEAHWGFGSETAFPLVNEYNNLVVLRTFSKFYGAAAIRVGYAVAQPMITRPLHAMRASGEIAGPSMVVASAILDNHHLFEAWAERTKQGRDTLRKEIAACGLRVWGRYGFSLLVEFSSCESAMHIAGILASDGILVKSGFPPPVDRCMLLACGSNGVAGRFMKSFKGALNAVHA